MNFDTIAIHGGYDPNDNAKSMAVPIYQTSAYLFENTQHAVDLFNLDEQGDIYTRISNPTTNILETRMAMLEGGVGALATASGHSATLIACLNILNPGDEIISSAALYGGTYTLFSSTFKKFGIKVKFVDNEEPESYEKAITDKTKLVFAEIIGNPNLNVPDIEKIAVIAHKNKIPFMLDNTFATPYLFKPFDYGVDIIVYSATKYLCGHGTSIGGLIVDSGKFNWNESDKFPELTASGEFSQGLNYTEKFGNAAYIVKARAQMLRDFGPSISPFNSFLILQGLETLALRMQRHSESALKIAQFLKNHKNVSWVNYPGLETDDSHEKAQKVFEKRAKRNNKLWYKRREKWW